MLNLKMSGPIPTIRELEKLSDRDLITACLKDERVNSACNDYNFWIERISKIENKEYYEEMLTEILGYNNSQSIEKYEVYNDKIGYLQFIIDKEYVDIRKKILNQSKSALDNKLAASLHNKLAASLDKCYRGITVSRDKKYGQEHYFLKQLRNMLQENKTTKDYINFADECFVALNKFKSK